MLCLPALTPVANEAHAVGDSGECVVPSGRTPLPALASFCMLGSLPSSIHRCTRRGSMPSKPSTTSFWRNFSGGRPEPQPTASAAEMPTSAARIGFKECEIITFDMRVLGVDVGARRVGLAISDATRTLARPLETIAVTDGGDAVTRVTARIVELAAEDDG